MGLIGNFSLTLSIYAISAKILCTGPNSIFSQAAAAGTLQYVVQQGAGSRWGGASVLCMTMQKFFKKSSVMIVVT